MTRVQDAITARELAKRPVLPEPEPEPKRRKKPEPEPEPVSYGYLEVSEGPTLADRTDDDDG